MPFSTTVYLFPTVENIPAMRGLASDLVTAGQASGRRLALHGSVISDDGPTLSITTLWDSCRCRVTMSA